MSRADFQPGDVVFVAGVSDGHGFGNATILGWNQEDGWAVRYEKYPYKDGQDGGWGPEKLDYHNAYMGEVTLVAPLQEEIDAAIASIKTVLERETDDQVQH